MLLIFVIIILAIIGILYGVSKKSTTSTTKETIKIGAILPLTGTAAPNGIYLKNGIDLAIDEINSNGGINGRKIEVIYEDSKNDPAEGVSVFNKIVNTERNVHVIVVFGSGVSNPLIPIANEKKINLLLTAVALPGITDRSEYAFRFFPNENDDANTMISCLENKFPEIDKLAFLYVNDEFGVSALKAFEKRFKGELVIKEAYGKSDTDFRTIVTKVKYSNAKGVYISGYTSSGVLLIKQLREADIKIPIFAYFALALPAHLKATGEAANGVYYTATLFDASSSDPVVSKFVESYKKRYGEVPNSFNAFTYDTIYMLKFAIEKYDYTTEGIRRGLSEIKNFPGVLGYSTVQQNRDVIYPLRVVQFDNGGFKEICR